MTNRHGRRRPSLTRWLTDKVEGLTGGRWKDQSGRGRTGSAVPPIRRPTAERASAPTGGGPASKASSPPGPSPEEQQRAAELEKLKVETTRLAKEFDDAQVMLLGKEAEFRNDIQEAQERNAELLDKVVKLTQRDRELQAKIIDAQFDGSGAKAKLKNLDMELRDLRRSHQAKEQQVAELAEQLEAAKLARPAPGDASKKTRAEAEQEQQKLQQNLDQIAALTRERDALGARLSDAETEMGSLRDKLTAAYADVRAGGQIPTNGSSPAPVLGPVVVPPPAPASDPRPPGVTHLASGPAQAPLKAEAAGKRPAICRRAIDARALRGAVAEQLLAQAQELGGFARLPEPFVKSLSQAAPQRTGRTDAKPTGQGGSSRGRRNRRGRSRRNRPNNRQ